MKICVTSKGDTLSAEVDPRFGRAAFFLLIDTETLKFDAVANHNINSAGGAGTNSAKLVVDGSCEAVLTGNCGPKAMAALQAGSIAIYTGVSGTVEQAVENFKNGCYNLAKEPSVGNKAGM